MINLFKRNLKINIVTVPPPLWALSRIANTYAKLIPNTKVSTEVDPKADINFYVHYDLFTEKTNTIDVGYFTHKEIVYSDEEYLGLNQEGIRNYKESAISKALNFDKKASEMDWCIAMCQKTADLLPLEKTTVNLVPPDPQFQKRNLILGVVGISREKPRKRYAWVEELSKIEGVEIKMTKGAYRWEELPEFYKSIDYLLVLSDNEGGPLPLVEALAMGKPVISSNVGFSDAYTTLKYDTLEELKTLIKGLIIKKDAWETSARDLYQIFQMLYNKQSKK